MKDNKMKQTEIGMIPDDWEVKKLGDICKITSGEAPSKFNFSSSGIPYFKVEQMNNCLKYQKETPYHIVENIKVEKGSIIFPKRGAAIETNKIRILFQDSFFDTNIMALTLEKSIDNDFFYYWLVRKELWKIADTTSIPQINNKHITPLQIPLPPTLAEQKKIAQALSDVDSVIATLEKLIAKKKNIKQGTMQLLLTGKKRLPGFAKSDKFKQTEIGEIPADWAVVSLNNLIEDISDGPFGSNLKTEHYTTEKEARIIQLSNVGEDGWDNENIKYTTFLHAKELSRCIVPYGAIVIAKMMPAGRAILCPNKEAMYILGSDCVKFIPNCLVDSKYFVYYTKCDAYLNQIKENTQGSTRARTSVTKLKKIGVVLPPKPEQTAIANVLSDMDREIEMLEAKLKKYRDLKTGMMQQLLTGRIRLG